MRFTLLAAALAGLASCASPYAPPSSVLKEVKDCQAAAASKKPLPAGCSVEIPAGKNGEPACVRLEGMRRCRT